MRARCGGCAAGEQRLLVGGKSSLDVIRRPGDRTCDLRAVEHRQVHTVAAWRREVRGIAQQRQAGQNAAIR